MFYEGLVFIDIWRRIDGAYSPKTSAGAHSAHTALKRLRASYEDVNNKDGAQRYDGCDCCADGQGFQRFPN